MHQNLSVIIDIFMYNPPVKVLARRFPSLARLIGEFHPYRGEVLLVLVLGLVISVVQPASLKFVQELIDRIQAGAPSRFFVTAPLYLVGIFLVSGLAKYSYNVIRRVTSEKVILKIRQALFEKYLNLPLLNLESRRSGEMLAHLQNDLAQVTAGLDSLWALLKEPFTFIFLIGWAFYCDWQLALSTVVVAPLVILLFSRSGWAVKRYSAKNLEQLSDLMSLSQETLLGARVIKIFRLEKILVEKFRSIQARYLHTMTKSIRVQELATPLVEFVGAALMAGVIGFGAYRILEGEMTAGSLVSFIVALGLSQMPIKDLNNVYLRLKAAEAALDRIYLLLASVDYDKVARGRTRLTGFSDKIVYDRVTLHLGEKVILEDVSFELMKGQTLALAGPSGGGKTSLVNLLPRLLDATTGSITWDGHDIRDILLEDLRGLVSFVTQDTFLFNDTILENIRYGCPTATASQIETAAQMAHCMEFIERKPQGFLTRIGDRGLQLSGGERQRLAIARAFLKSAPVLVLDEATSSLDSHSERMVQDALRNLMQGRTTILVAHRLSTLVAANQILVLRGGHITESGTHSELVSSKGLYSSLYRQQVDFSQ